MFRFSGGGVMASRFESFNKKSLPAGFSRIGVVKCVNAYEWNGINAATQTPDYFCLIGDPRVNGAHVPLKKGANMPGYNLDQGNGYSTVSVVGSSLSWGNIAFNAGSILRFSYVFLRSGDRGVYNSFAFFQAEHKVGTGTPPVFIRAPLVPIAQTARHTHGWIDPGSPSSGNFYVWQSSAAIFFPQAFDGTLTWGCCNGKTLGPDGNVPSDADARFDPSALAIDFISIIEP